MYEAAAFSTIAQIKGNPCARKANVEKLKVKQAEAKSARIGQAIAGLLISFLNSSGSST